MKQILSDHDRNRLDTLISNVEKGTDTQIVLAIIKRSDNYAELPWKAFARGSSISGLLVLLLVLVVDVVDLVVDEALVECAVGSSRSWSR